MAAEAAMARRLEIRIFILSVGWRPVFSCSRPPIYADRRCGRAGRIFLRFTRKNQQESSKTFMKSLNFAMPGVACR